MTTVDQSRSVRPPSYDMAAGAHAWDNMSFGHSGSAQEPTGHVAFAAWNSANSTPLLVGERILEIAGEMYARKWTAEYARHAFFASSCLVILKTVGGTTKHLLNKHKCRRWRALNNRTRCLRRTRAMRVQLRLHFLENWNLDKSDTCMICFIGQKFVLAFYKTDEKVH